MVPCNNNTSGGAGGGGGGWVNKCTRRGMTLCIAVCGILFLCYFFPWLAATINWYLGCPGKVATGPPSGGGGVCANGCGVDMDNTGLPDIALESLGGLILSIGDAKPAPAKVQVSILGIPIFTQQSPPPETIIRYGVEPGNCWAFQGSKANVVIQLIKPAVITGIHLEHIHKSLDPYGILGSAPKEFQIWGLRDAQCLELGKRELLGSFTFNPTVKPLQYFEIKAHQNEQFGQIELEILSNHGDAVTCIYRIRVHGDIKPKVIKCQGSASD